MSLLKQMSTDASAQEGGDFVGGSYVLPTGAYKAIIKMAYLGESSGGAISTNWTFNIEGTDLKQTIYITSGNAKGKVNYYLDKNGDKKLLPGYELVDHITLLACDKSIQDMKTEEKLVAVYNFEARAEVPTKVEVLTELLGKEITLVVQQVKENKRVNVDGTYKPTADIREFNEVIKAVHVDGRTVTEIKAGKEEATYLNDWLARNQGKVRDKTTTEGLVDSASAGSATSGITRPKTSLFGSTN